MGTDLEGGQVRWVAELAGYAGLGGLRILEGPGLGGVIGFSQSFSRISHFAAGRLTSCPSMTMIRGPGPCVLTTPGLLQDKGREQEKPRTRAREQYQHWTDWVLRLGSFG